MVAALCFGGPWWSFGVYCGRVPLAFSNRSRRGGRTHSGEVVVPCDVKYREYWKETQLRQYDWLPFEGKETSCILYRQCTSFCISEFLMHFFCVLCRSNS